MLCWWTLVTKLNLKLQPLATRRQHSQGTSLKRHPWGQKLQKLTDKRELSFHPEPARTC